MALQPGTLRRAAIALALIIGVVALLAWFLTTPAVRGPLHPYFRLGGSAGAEALRQELERDFPADGPVAPLLRRLQELGFSCEGQPDGLMPCTAMAQTGLRRLTRVDVAFRLVEERRQGLAVSITEAPPSR